MSAVHPLRTKGSPPVIFIFLIPSSAAAQQISSISSKERRSDIDTSSTPSGIQYRQRRLQRSVMDILIYSIVRPYPSIIVFLLLHISCFRVCNLPLTCLHFLYFPNPQFGNVQTGQDRHNPPSPSVSISSFVTFSPVISLGNTRSNIVLFAYITHPGSPSTGIVSL